MSKCRGENFPYDYKQPQNRRRHNYDMKQRKYLGLKIVGTIVKNLVATANWRLGFLHRWFNISANVLYLLFTIFDVLYTTSQM